MVTGAASRLEVMADWLEVAARTAAAEGAAKVAAAVGLARSWVVVAVAAGKADGAACSGGQG